MLHRKVCPIFVPLLSLNEEGFIAVRGNLIRDLTQFRKNVHENLPVRAYDLHLQLLRDIRTMFATEYLAIGNLYCKNKCDKQCRQIIYSIHCFANSSGTQSDKSSVYGSCEQ